jgi:MSHA pilin protein MshA
MKNFNKQKGFTLIELVVVIVILGILAVTAAPKFIDLTGDAKKSVMKGVKGSIESAVSIVHAKALIENKTSADSEITIGTEIYALVHGYPSAAGKGTPDGTAGKGWGISKLVDLDSTANGDFTVTIASPALFQYKGVTDVTTCQLSYADAANSESRPVITETLGGC